MSYIDYKCYFFPSKTHDYYFCDGSVSDEAIIYCHGGSFRYGDKGDNSDFLTALAEKTSMQVYSVGYRNIDEARSLRTMIDDIVEIISLIVDRSAITHFHIMGASSGAYLVWIMSIMISNPEKFGISSKFTIDSVTLISGYFLFKRNDPITQMLCLFPAFQDFPKSIKDVEMDYSGYDLPPILLITGDADGCREDSEVLFNAVKTTNTTEIELSVSSSDTDMADHCFIIERPDAEVSKKVFEQICTFINR